MEAIEFVHYEYYPEMATFCLRTPSTNSYYDLDKRRELEERKWMTEYHPNSAIGLGRVLFIII